MYCSFFALLKICKQLFSIENYRFARKSKKEEQWIILQGIVFHLWLNRTQNSVLKNKNICFRFFMSDLYEFLRQPYEIVRNICGFLELTIAISGLRHSCRLGHIPGPMAIYRRPLAAKDLSGVPLRHVFVVLQREQIRSPAHALWNLTRHLRHRRSLGRSSVGCSFGVSPAGAPVMIAPSRGRTVW